MTNVDAGREPDPTARTESEERRVPLGRRLRTHRLTPEERLTQVIEEHRRELEEHTRRFEETLADLERREQLLSDSRASVERLLRLGTKDLDARETDVAQLVRDLTAREKRIRDEEDELARRRTELGAVELKRLAIEQRERTLAAREEQLEAAERDLADEDATAGGRSITATLAFLPGAQYALVEIEPIDAEPGGTIEIEGRGYVVSRVGPSPLPGDPRRCAYLTRLPDGLSRSDGTS